jgi:predicted DsbA family dithiol-disulfide isomerase
VLQLDVWSDIACPWCYLGKRRLEAAIAESGKPTEVTWHAYELSPELPPEGMLISEHLGKRFGLDNLRAMDAQMTEYGKADGIEFHFERRRRSANTRLAHRAIRIAHAMGGTELQGTVVEACFKANFTDGVDVSNLEELLTALTPTGIDIAELRLRLTAEDALAEVIADEKLAGELGIDGVPFFIAEGKLALGGAQSPEIFAGFLVEAAGLEPHAP